MTLCLLGRPCLRRGAREIDLSPKDAALLCLAALVAVCSPIFTSSAVRGGTPTHLLGILALR